MLPRVMWAKAANMQSGGASNSVDVEGDADMGEGSQVEVPQMDIRSLHHAID